jgi:pimeloyl-ACP methyl ester carboxylesterase
MTSQRAPRLAVALLLLAACSPKPAPDATDAPAPAGETPAALAQGTHVFQTSDGNAMPYTVTGSGDVNIVLVHCWMCDATFWDAQVPELAKRYRTIALDLPGHGQATANRAEWTVAAYGDDLAALIRKLDLSNVILVGHSMGGPVSLRAAALSKPRVKGIVAVDTLHDAEFEFSGPQVEGYLKAFEADFAGTCKPFVAQMVPETGAEEIRTKIQTTSCDDARKPIGIALMRSFGAVDESWMQAAGVPIRAINAAEGQPTRTETNRKYADFDAVTLQGVGHYLHMTRPAEFNPLLLETIAKLVSNPS